MSLKVINILEADSKQLFELRQYMLGEQRGRYVVEDDGVYLGIYVNEEDALRHIEYLNEDESIIK